MMANPSADADPFDLDARRPRIEQLYLKQHKPLRDVMRILSAETGCTASRNMYLKKLELWGARKKSKRVVHRKYIQDTKQVREEITPKTEVVRYLKWRRETADLALKIKERLGPDFQLPLLPTLDLPEPFNSTIRLYHSAYNAQLWMMAPLIPLHTAENQLYNPEKERQETRARLRQFYLNVAAGARTVVDQPRAGGVWLELGFRMIRQFVEEAEPELMRMVTLIIIMVHSGGLLDVAAMLTQYLYQVSVAVLGQNHVFTQAAYGLHQNWHSLDTIKSLIQIYYDATESVLGKRSDIALQHYYAIIMAIRPGMKSLEGVASKYETLIEYSQTLPSLRLHIASKREYAQSLFKHKHYAKGMALLQELSAYSLQENADRDALPTAMLGAVDLGDQYMRQPQIEGFEESPEAHKRRYVRAEAQIRTSVERMKEKLGEGDSMTLFAANLMSTFYKTHGHPEDSQKEYDSIAEILERTSLKD